ncbi:MAG: hypothetical protein ACR2PX_02300 [Endozoicomonas sp.]|uniref:hypothetical protein n=1 Tax=Endozoicomonas sp. TaxID=1892382 RepID=UPI003D9AD63F
MYKFFVVIIIHCFLLFVPKSLASFTFSSSSYQASFPSKWSGGTATVELDISLQACWFFLGRSCENSLINDSDFYSIGNLNTSQIVFSNGSQELNIIQSLVFSHDGRSFDLLLPSSDSGMIFDSGSLSFVTGKLELTIQGELADAALPGVYTASVDIFGMSRIFQWLDSANVNVDIEIPDRVRVSGLKDIYLPSGNGSVSSGWVSFCVFSQGGSDFKLRAYGSNEINRFVLQSSGGSEFDYNLMIREQGRNNTRKTITPNDSNFIPLYVWKGADSQNCSDYTNNNMELEVKTAGGANSLPAGVYQDTITIVVEPD